MITDKNLILDTGDTMLIYTDGITEARRKYHINGPNNTKGEMFGGEKLKTILTVTGEIGPEAVKNGILEELECYDCDDDVTMVVVRKT